MARACPRTDSHDLATILDPFRTIFVDLGPGRQISAGETGQMSSVETGQMSAAETGQMSAVETRQMSSVARIVFLSQHTMLMSQKSQLWQCHNVQVSDRRSGPKSMKMVRNGSRMVARL